MQSNWTREALQQVFSAHLHRLQAHAILPADLPPVILDACKQMAHGDYASPIAFALAQQAGGSAREWAMRIVQHWDASQTACHATVAGPGFVNLTWADPVRLQQWQQILTAGARFGATESGKGQSVYLEYVSANPTGPLHVGHGRSAAYGSALGHILRENGYAVHRVYYVNDAGRQMHILALSVYLRYLAACGNRLNLPSGVYQGEYVQAIADACLAQHGDSYGKLPDNFWDALPEDADRAVDSLIARCQDFVGPVAWAEVFFDAGLQSILSTIRHDLADFGVTYDEYFSEKSLLDSDAVAKSLAALAQGGHLYTQDGATWFRSTQFGDDKDRVVCRENGQYTYFATDIAYHDQKCSGAFSQLIDVFGADHHGYVPRLRAAIEALGHDADTLQVPLVQFAILYRGKERVPMSTRSGEFVTLRALMDEVGVDAARFFYLMRKVDQHVDFDLELAKSQTHDNPVYYVQYAHARICQVLAEAKRQGRKWPEVPGLSHWEVLTEDQERALLRLLAQYPDWVAHGAHTLEVHHLTQYVRDVAAAFHRYYNACPFIVEDDTLLGARLSLIRATAQVLQNALSLLGVSAPSKM